MKILLICRGNIRRSPMAGLAVKDPMKKAGLEDQLQTASAATSAGEIGGPVNVQYHSCGTGHFPSCVLAQLLRAALFQ